MKRFLILLFALFLIACQDKVEEKSAEVDQPDRDSIKTVDVSALEAQLKKDGYQTFSYKKGDTTYLMQQYYMLFLMSGPKRSQDSTEAAELQKKHLAHLSRLYEEGYTSLTGPMGGNGDIRGIVVFNTATKKEADSLANLDPMVKAGRLVVEVRPWWVAKGGKLK